MQKTISIPIAPGFVLSLNYATKKNIPIVSETV